MEQAISEPSKMLFGTEQLEASSLQRLKIEIIIGDCNKINDSIVFELDFNRSTELCRITISVD